MDLANHNKQRGNLHEIYSSYPDRQTSGIFCLEVVEAARLDGHFS